MKILVAPLPTLLAVMLVCGLGLSCLADESVSPRPRRLLVLTGGHDYDSKAFFAALDTLTEGEKPWEYQHVTFPDALELLKPGLEETHDAVLLYDMYQTPLTPEQQQNIFALLRRGIGWFVLHHSLGGLTKHWDEYRDAIGGAYIYETVERFGEQHALSTYRHDETLNVVPVRPTTFVSQRLSPFTIVDETYGNLYVAPYVRPVLTTDNPTSSRVIAWQTRFAQSRIFVCALGHDAQAYNHPDFRVLLTRSLEWVSVRETTP